MRRPPNLTGPRRPVMALSLVGRRSAKRVCVKVGRRVYCGRRVKRQVK